jgi:hypothetical protein
MRARKSNRLEHGKLVAKAIGVLAALGVLAAHPAAGQKYTFKKDDISKADQTTLYGINNAGTVVGDTIDNTGAQQCYMLMGKTKTAIIDPAAPISSCFGISGTGAIAGSYPANSFSNGFVYTNGAFTDIIFPTATAGTIAYGVNDNGEVSGFYADNAGSHGFIFDGTNYQSYDLPGQDSTLVGDLNDNGQFVAQGITAGVVTSWLITSGNPVQLVVPGAVTTLGEGLNNAGYVALVYFDQAGVRHGAVYNSKKNKYYFPIDDPGQAGTSILGINDAQTLAGRFIDANGDSNGFVAKGKLK